MESEKCLLDLEFFSFFNLQVCSRLELSGVCSVCVCLYINLMGWMWLTIEASGAFSSEPADISLRSSADKTELTEEGIFDSHLLERQKHNFTSTGSS